jgi:hypothetical protein
MQATSGKKSGTAASLYFRLMREGHRERWRECIRDAMLEFDAVRAVVR